MFPYTFTEKIMGSKQSKTNPDRCNTCQSALGNSTGPQVISHLSYDPFRERLLVEQCGLSQLVHAKVISYTTDLMEPQELATFGMLPCNFYKQVPTNLSRSESIRSKSKRFNRKRRGSSSSSAGW